jgi:hypothetical protein
MGADDLFNSLMARGGYETLRCAINPETSISIKGSLDATRDAESLDMIAKACTNFAEGTCPEVCPFAPFSRERSK